MVRFEQSQVLNTSLPLVWQVVGDITNWPTLFAELSRVQVNQRAGDTITATGTDSRARSFTMNVTTTTADQSNTRAMTVLMDSQQPGPGGVRKLVWTLSSEASQTVLTLHADYDKPLPFVGALLARLRGHVSAEQYLGAAFDAVVHQAHEQVRNYQETVQTMLSRKGSNIISALPGDSVNSICGLINTHRIGAVLIREADGALVGLVSERDVVGHLATTGPAVLEQPASDIMTRDLIVCEPGSDLLFVMTCMTENKIRHLPVMDGDNLVGVISIGDVVQQRMHSLEAESGTLRDYIAAREWRYQSHHGVPGAEAPVTLTDTTP